MKELSGATMKKLEKKGFWEISSRPTNYMGEPTEFYGADCAKCAEKAVVGFHLQNKPYCVSHALEIAGIVNRVMLEA